MNGEGAINEADGILLFAFINYLSLDLKDDYDSLSEISLLEDSSRFQKIHDVISQEGASFKAKEIAALLKLVWAVTLRSISQLPGNLWATTFGNNAKRIT